MVGRTDQLPGSCHEHREAGPGRCGGREPPSRSSIEYSLSIRRRPAISRFSRPTRSMAGVGPPGCDIGERLLIVSVPQPSPSPGLRECGCLRHTRAVLVSNCPGACVRQRGILAGSLPKARLPVRVRPSASGEGGCPFKPGQARGCRAQPIQPHSASRGRAKKVLRLHVDDRTCRLYRIVTWETTNSLVRDDERSVTSWRSAARLPTSR